jgi:hypothetical protein
MRVLLGPGAELAPGGRAAAIAELLAGPEGAVVSLRDVGVRNFSRRLSEAEVALLRETLLGLDPGSLPGEDRERGGIVGYVCRGVGAARWSVASTPTDAKGTVAEVATIGPADVVAVTDHANLTWRSPLAGLNDDRLGPRFPNVAGVYAPEVVHRRVSERGDGSLEGGPRDDGPRERPHESVPHKGMIVVSGVVAGVFDDGHLSGYEADMASSQGYAAVSSELVPVVIVAGHLGLWVAAAVVMAELREKETRGGRS